MGEGSPLPYAPTWADQTSLHPIALLVLIVSGGAVLLLPRRWGIIPIIVVTCFIAPGQRVVLASLDLNLLRLMVLVGWLRLVLRGEHRGFRRNALDIMLILWIVSATVIFTIQRGTTEALVNRLGYAFDAVGMYFLFRSLLQNWADVTTAVRGFMIVSIPVALFFLIEHFSGHNLFAIFGGVPEITLAREGHWRCQGAFPHPILAGCFWAAVMPLFAARWWAGRDERAWAVLGVGAAGLIVVLCMSSTPVVAVIWGVVAACFFPLRRSMRMVRWGTVAGLVILHFVMNAPVWHLIARVDIVGGSTGWHRYYLIDQAIRRFDEWALVGTPSTAHWDEWGFLWDVTNQYVFEAVSGGALTLVLFLLLIGMAFREVGRLWRGVERDRGRVALVWALGVCLFVHCVNYMAVTYFGQVSMIWYLHLAMIASLVPVEQQHRIRIPQPPQHSPGGRPRGARRYRAADARPAAECLRNQWDAPIGLES